MKTKNLTKYCVLIAFISLFNNALVFSQKSNPKFITWSTSITNVKTAEKISFLIEYQNRRNDFLSHKLQSLARLGVEYSFTKKITGTGGYAWFLTHISDFSFNEHRLWKQVTHNQSYKRIVFNQRLRAEQRFLENKTRNQSGEFVLDGYNYNHRIRYRFMIILPINKKSMENNTLFVSISDEPFFRIEKNYKGNLLERNRFLGTVGWRFNEKYTFQLSYMNHFIIKNTSFVFEKMHTIQPTITYNWNRNTQSELQ